MKNCKYSRFGILAEMSILAEVTIFFLSVLKIFKGDGPVTLGNALSRFQNLYYKYNKDINVGSELNTYVKSLNQLNDQQPAQLLVIAKESHCPVFNYYLHLVRKGIQFDPLQCFKSLKLSDGFDLALNVTSVKVIGEAIEILENLKLKDQSKNEESFKIVSEIVTIAKEFSNKIQDPMKRERKLLICERIAFSVENLAIDYQNGTIDYGAFMAVFYEIKSLYLSKFKGEHFRKRLKKLKSIFEVYAALILKSQCYLIFDFYPVEELFYLIIRNRRNPLGRKTSFKEIFLNPWEKNHALETFYILLGSRFRRFGKFVIGEAYSMNTTLFIKMRFFTKLVNFLNVRENYDYFCNSDKYYRKYLSDDYLWIFMGLSKIEQYLDYYLRYKRDFHLKCG
jgi:hypothetical protein